MTVKADVVFIAPPFHSLARPSLALGILQSLCRDLGLSCKTIYANLYFARYLKPLEYEEVCDLGATTLFGEWLFKNNVFSTTHNSNDDEYTSYLADRGVDASLISSCLGVRTSIDDYIGQISELILACSPKIIGFSTTFQQTMASLAISRVVRRKLPDSIICIGGANCDAPMGEFLADHFDSLDHVFVGEAEHAFVSFIETAREVDFDKRRLQAHYGKIIKGGRLKGAPKYGPPDFADYFKTLDSVGLSARIEPSIPFEGSRGCWWGEKHHCTFCGLNATNMTFRSRTAADVIHEIVDHVKTYKVDRFHAVDNILSPDHLKDLLPSLQSHVKDCSLFFEIKSNIKRRDLKVLASANVTWIQPGIESLKDDALSLMKKGVTAIQNVRFLRDCHEVGIIPIWNWLYGFPGEDFTEAIENAVAIIEKIPHLMPPTNGPSRIRLDRYSPNFERKDDFGFSNVRPFVDYKYIFPDFADHEIERYAYFFSYDGWLAEDPPGMTRLRVAIRKWRDRFNSDDTPILRVMEMSDETHMIIDSRYAGAVSFLSGSEGRVLRSVREPMSLGRIRECCPDLHGSRLSNILRKLVAQGLVIESGGLYLSVVCDDAEFVPRRQDIWKNPLGRVKPDLGSCQEVGPALARLPARLVNV